MSDDLRDKLLEGYQDLPRTAGALLVGLSPEQCSWRPSSKAWSIAEVFDHLRVSAEQYLPKIREGIERFKESPEKAKPPSKVLSPLLNRFILSMEQPGRIRLIAPPSFRPAPEAHASSRGTADILNGFIEPYQDLERRLEETQSSTELALVRVANPVVPLFSFTLGQAMLLLLVHARRHFQQVKGIKARPDFPANRNSLTN